MINTENPTTLTRRELLIRIAAVSAIHVPLLATPSRAQAESNTLHLKHLHLKSNKLDEQEIFYRDVLKLPVVRTDTAVTITAGESRITFTKDSNIQDPFYHFAFTIPENKLDNAMEWLAPRCPILNIKSSKRKTIHFGGNWNADACYFFDPSGNILEFIAHHNLNNGTRKKFSEKQILHISEIGLVTPDVPKFQDEIEEKLGLTPYSEPSDTFSAIGDVNGVLIVVQKDRIWLPTTDVPSEIFPTRVELSGARDGHRWEEFPYEIELLG